MKKVLPFIFIIPFLFSCEDKKEISLTEVYKIRELGQLSTSEYTLSKVLQVDDKGAWYAWGNRKILISCKAKAKAGIDLRKLSIDEVDVEEGFIRIGLPSVELQSFEMLPESIKTEMMELSGFRDDFSQEERLNILKQGEVNLRKNLVKTGIYEDAYSNAANYLQSFYKELGFTKIDIYAKIDKV